MSLESDGDYPNTLQNGSRRELKRREGREGEKDRGNMAVLCVWRVCMLL